MKKLLMLGGAFSQIPAIVHAKSLGYYVITCDYLPSNPGHRFSDQYVNVSTTEKEKVLQIAQDNMIDGIIAYASDPSAETAAYVAEKLQLVGGGYRATEILSKKDLFRNFQRENGFYTPWFISVTDKLQYRLSEISFPCVVKPVDSSGSKGITVLYNNGNSDNNDNVLHEKIMYAMQFSRCKRVIVEEFISSNYCQLHGDGIVKDGELVYLMLGDQRFKNSVPIGTSYPSATDTEYIVKAKKTIAELIKKVNFQNGGINVEIRITDKGDVFVVEIGARSGGNYIPQLVQLSQGVDEVDILLKQAMNDDYDIPNILSENFCFQYIIGSRKDGIYKGLNISETAQQSIVRLFEHKGIGDMIVDYNNSSGVVGVALMRFKNFIDMEQFIGSIESNISVKCE